ncbi:hypothetical protein C8R47DRAFT_1084507 [Mycena vitilis]|nr:hypothetical protein C8R47DRAFT_1084507 [Mycena vitilis]
MKRPFSASNHQTHRQTEALSSDVGDSVGSRAKRAKKNPITPIILPVTLVLPLTSCLPGGQRETYPVNITSQTSAKNLSKMCDDFKLGVRKAASKSVMIEKLAIYAEAKDWSNLDTQAQRNHLGPMSGTANTGGYLSRRAGKYKQGDLQPEAPRVPTALATDVLKRNDEMTPEDAERLFSYCEAVVRENPPLPPEQRKPPITETQAQWRQGVKAGQEDVSIKLDSLIRAHYLLASSLGQGTAIKHLVETITPTDGTIRGQGSASHETGSSTSLATSPTFTPANNATMPLAIEDLDSSYFEYSANTTFASAIPSHHASRSNDRLPSSDNFSTASLSALPSSAYTSANSSAGSAAVLIDAPPDPRDSYYHDGEVKFAVDRLSKHWDQNSSYWNPTPGFLPEWHGKPVPLKEWLTAYKKKDGIIKLFTPRYSNWKLLIEEYQQGSPDQFWTRYSNEKGPFTITQLYSEIRKVVTERCATEIPAIQARYGPKWVEAFGWGRNKEITIKNARAFLNRHAKNLAEGKGPAFWNTTNTL